METTEALKNHIKIEESKQRFENLVRDATFGIVVLTGVGARARQYKQTDLQEPLRKIDPHLYRNAENSFR